MYEWDIKIKVYFFALCAGGEGGREGDFIDSKNVAQQ